MNSLALGSGRMAADLEACIRFAVLIEVHPQVDLVLVVEMGHHNNLLAQAPYLTKGTSEAIEVACLWLA